MQHSLADVTGDVGPNVTGDIEIVPGAIRDFQEVSASAWGRAAQSARRASDAYARAVRASGDELLVARVAGELVGCASLSIRPPVATLGSMSTLPGERGRGIQSAMIRHRLQMAERAGCTVAVSTVAPDGSSERNLLRAGFEPWFTIVTVSRPAAREGR